MTRAAGRSLLGISTPLATTYDVALLDLDGVVYVGPDPIPSAAPALAKARAAGMRLAFVTTMRRATRLRSLRIWWRSECQPTRPRSSRRHKQLPRCFSNASVPVRGCS